MCWSLRNNFTSISMVVFSSIVQWVLIRESEMFTHALPFLSGLSTADTFSGNEYFILCSIFPIPFFLMLFSGKVYDLTEGYGKVLIVREYSKNRLLCVMYLRSLLWIGLIACYLLALFSIGESEQWEPLTGGQTIAGIFLYGLTLAVCVQLQFALELYFKAHQSWILVILFFTLSLFLAANEGSQSCISFLLFPNLAFAHRNGVLAGEDITGEALWLTLIWLTLGVFCLKKFKRKDIM